jgi:hypothetical protein
VPRRGVERDGRGIEQVEEPVAVIVSDDEVRRVIWPQNAVRNHRSRIRRAQLPARPSREVGVLNAHAEVNEIGAAVSVEVDRIDVRGLPIPHERARPVTAICPSAVWSGLKRDERLSERIVITPRQQSVAAGVNVLNKDHRGLKRGATCEAVSTGRLQ